MQTLTQYEYLDRDLILKGVCEWIVNESPILKKLPFKSIQGNSYKYNVESTMPTASWLSIGDTIVEGTGTYTQRSTDIYTLIQNSYTSKTAKKLNGTQDPEAIDIEMGAKAMAHEFENTFIRGQTSTKSTTKQFKGLLRMLAEMESATTTDLDAPNNTQAIAVSSTSGAITMALLDEMLDAIKPGKPDLILCSRRGRRKINALQRASGGGVTMVKDTDFGLFMEHYNTIPIMVSDYVPDNLPDAVSSIVTISTWNPDTTRASTVDNTIIFALKLSENDVSGLQAGEMERERETFVESKHAIVNRFSWEVGAAAFRKYSLAALINGNPDS